MKYFAFLFLCVPLTVFADIAGKVCDHSSPVQSNIWRAVDNVATAARNAVCDHMRLASQDSLEQAKASLAQLYTAIINQPTFSGAVKEDIVTWLSTVDNNSTRYLHYADLSVVTGRGAQLNDFTTHSLTGKFDTTVVQIGSNALKRCNCEDDLRELDTLLEIVNYAVSDSYIQPSKLSMKELNSEWASFLENAREQTYWDIGFTTWANRFLAGDSGVDFDRPPMRQFFIVRPNIVVDNVGSAVNGDELKESLALEVVGINWWQDKACFNLFACGASITVNYADRAGVESTGWGVMFHVNNTYSFGISKFGGDTGVFLTIDLLQLLKDKKSTYNSYIQSRVAGIK